MTGMPRGDSEARPPPLPAWELVSRQKEQPAPAGGPAATEDAGSEARMKPVCQS